MVVRDFPDALERIEFWTVEDVESESPARALARIRESVEHSLKDYLKAFACPTFPMIAKGQV
jgi:hypothetical protein